MNVPPIRAERPNALDIRIAVAYDQARLCRPGPHALRESKLSALLARLPAAGRLSRRAGPADSSTISIRSSSNKRDSAGPPVNNPSRRIAATQPPRPATSDNTLTLAE